VSATVVPTPEPGNASISVSIAPDGYVLLVPGQGEYLQLDGLNKPLTPGESVPLTFHFSDGSVAAVVVPVGLPTESVPRGSAAADEGNPEG
jgi:hypothetical protein